MYLALGMTPGTEAPKLSPTPLVDERFRHDAARGVAGAQKKHVIRSICHGMALVRSRQYLPHAGRGRRAQRPKLLAPLHVLRRVASFNDAIPLVRKKLSCRLREKDQAVDLASTRDLLEFPHD